MSVLFADSPTSSRRFARIIGEKRGERAGPSVVCVAGIHGNEASGILALERVFQALDSRAPDFRGELVGIAGNLTALAEGSRYIAHDLNRLWTPERVERVQATPAVALACPEECEMKELLAALEAAFVRARGEVHFMDLHTSSAFGAPFVLLGDTLRNRRFAFQFPVPVILGLEEQIDGVLLEYVNGLGHVTLGFEAGEHNQSSSVLNQEGAIWISLQAAGLVDIDTIPEAVKAVESLKQQAENFPRVLEILHRHPVTDRDTFVMEEGFENFDHVKAGQLLARDGDQDIHAAFAGRILLPLYQGQGSDGFFLGREIRPFWLRVSAFLRKLHAHKLVPILPGVRRHPGAADTFVVNRRVARWLVRQIFHLLGFRKVREDGDDLVVSRRPFDLEGPARSH